MSLKITLIGAGSVVFAKTLICDVLQFPELSDSTICLMDIDPQRLKVAKLMTEKIIAELGVPARVEATLDRRKAIAGAKYVICTVQVGGYKPGTLIDFEIPKKYGLKQTIADTLGVGGVFRALRTIPVINAIAQDIADVAAPDCLFLNYTNPMAMNCWAVDRVVGIPHVGLCHSVQGTSRMLANFANLPYEDVNYVVAGINHMAFFLRFEYRGQDAYPLLFKLLEDPAFTKEKVRMEMMRRTGYFVTESSEHQSEYVPYFIHHGEEVIKKFDIPIDEYLRRCESIISTWEKTEKELIGGDGTIRIPAQSHEYGCFIIHSRETGAPRVIYGNVSNRGLITNLPEGCCVEVPCLVDGNGLQPTRIGDLPAQLASICRTNINVQELAVEAAITNKREAIYHAVMLDPHAATVLTLDKVWAMCDELIEAHQKVGLLGDFKPVIHNTGRAYAGVGDRVIARATVDESGGENVSKKTLVELEIFNPTAKTVTVPLRLVPTQDGKPYLRQAVPVKVSVPAGKTILKKVEIKHTCDRAKKYSVRLDVSLKGVLAVSADVYPRRMIHAGEEIEIQLNGFHAAKETIRNNGKSLLVTAVVEDSKVSPNAQEPWDGSSVELFFANIGDPKVTQFFVLPQKSGKKAVVLDRSRKIVASIAAKQTVTKGGYTIELEIPKSLVEIDSEPFLFDSILSITALGDAHSGGRTSLSGKYDSHATSRHFAVVRLG